MQSYLNPEKALIFRIEHVDNLDWNLQENALYCRNSDRVNPGYVNIGDPSLISARAEEPVPIPPGGTLSDYVPFYFTPFSMMMYNIHTGRRVQQRHNSEIIFFVSSIFKLEEDGLPFIYTDQHAKAANANFFTDPEHLEQIDWDILQRRDFSRTDADPGKQVRYQAEALVYQSVPMSAILHLCCFDDETKTRVEAMVADSNRQISVQRVPRIYF
jgi:hypothetical protein